MCSRARSGRVYICEVLPYEWLTNSYCRKAQAKLSYMMITFSNVKEISIETPISA
jgi:hypothetical protein